MRPPQVRDLSWQALKSHVPGGRTSQSGVGAGDADTQPQGSASGSDGAMFAPPASAPSSTSNAREASPETPSRPLALLRVQILRARNLTAKDRNGKSDPFVVLSLPGTAPAPGGRNYRRQTPVIPKTLDPEWNATETTYEFEVIPEWYGPHGAAATRAAHELPEAPVDEYFPPEGGEAGGEDPEAGVQSSASSRSGSKRNISGAASRLFTPMRKLPRGAAAKVQAVRRSTPRPMRLRRGFSTATMTGGPGRQGVGPSVPEGSAQLNAHGHSHGAVGALEFVLWDKDRFSGNDYLGECSLPVDAWCAGARASANWDASEPIWMPLVSSRRNAKVSGELQVRVGFVPLPGGSVAGGGAAATEHKSSTDGTTLPSVDEIYQRLVYASSGSAGAGVRAVPASQAIGTAGPTEAFIDDGLSSDDDTDAEQENLTDEEGSESDEDDEDTATEAEDEEAVTAYDQHYQSIAGVPPTADQPPTMLSVTQGRPKNRIFGRRSRNQSAVGLAGEESEAPSASGTGRKLRVRKGGPRRRKTKEQGQQKKSNRNKEFAFKAQMGMDILGITMIEVKGAKDLPKWKNMTHTSFDMDPFTIISFGQKIFRTRVARHSLNPVWDEKLLFHVRRHESNFQIKFAIYDWDKMSANDYVGGASINVMDLINAAPKPDPKTGLYAPTEDGIHGMATFELPLARVEKDEDVKYGGKHAPVLTVEAKFTPYDALRQRFWRQLLEQYDTNDSNSLSQLELTSMLDSLGSTLTTQTIESWFSQIGKNPNDDDLTVDEAIKALEAEIMKPYSEKQYVQGGESLESGTATPADAHLELAAAASSMDNTGPKAPTASEDSLAKRPHGIPVPATVVDDSAVHETADKTEAVIKPVTMDKLDPVGGSMSSSSTPMEGSSSMSLTGGTPSSARREGSSDSLSLLSSGPEGSVERVIVLKSCPLCHMPRLSKKAEVDIVTHLAVCASQDWRRINSMVVGNFVTASQAHRKWYTRVITKISQGNYQLGANSANIIVQDRLTGELQEEKMQVYVRLGIRLLYKGAKSRMEGARVRRMLRNMSVKQGVKFDSPASAREIAPFIAFHNLNVDEILDPIDSFANFNEFFFRKLKPTARPNTDPDDPTTLVSGADSRFMAFESTDEATRIWIKGREFSVERLLGDSYKGKVDKYRGGGLAIMRLAPQDYHRFHCPCDATVGEFTWIEGQYYTVNPMAVRSTIDIYGENIRVVVPFHSPEFGTVYAVCIGAMMVGSTILTVKPGDKVKRGDEFGYFKFGGSTIVLLFEQDAVRFDDDILDNSRAAIETLVRVGMGVGKATGKVTGPAA